MMISVKEFCKRNSMSRTTCSRFMLRGMPVIKATRRVWIIENEAIEWIKKQDNLYKR